MSSAGSGRALAVHWKSRISTGAVARCGNGDLSARSHQIETCSIYIYIYKLCICYIYIYIGRYHMFAPLLFKFLLALDP